jgi:sulfonate transport system substrate-binding protein
MAANYLKSIGTSIEDVKVIGMDVTSGLTAFLAGEGDAVCAWNAIAYNAEDNGLLRVTDIGQMNLNNICGLCATPDAIENRLDLITKAWMVYYMTWEWCQESEKNMAKAVELYVESCEDEGVISDESICRRALEVFECPSVAEAYALMTETETDRSGSGEVTKASNLLFETLDFFISLGNYTSADREKIIDMNLVDPVVAENAVETLKALNYIN